MTKLFLCEFITGGGLCQSELPMTLLQEGQLMRDTVVNELKECPDYYLIQSYDARLPKTCDAKIPVYARQNVWETWQNIANSSEILWPIAPETDQHLFNLVKLGYRNQCTLISSTPGTIHLTSSKRKTTEHLKMAGLPAIYCYDVALPIPASPTGWVIKPDDGVGGNETRLYLDKKTLTSAIKALPQPENYIIQPYLEGSSISLSLLCFDGQTELLACNQQNITLGHDHFHLKEIIINGATQYWSLLFPLAQKIAATLPGLRGYIGVDLVLTQSGPIILEINPRLTSSYVKLSASLNCPISPYILTMFREHRLPKLPIKKPIPKKLIL